MVTDVPLNATDGSEDTQPANSAEILDQCLACGIIAIDAQSRITAWSPAAENVLGLSARACIGQSIEILPSPIREVLQRSPATREPIRERHLTLPGANGANVMLRISTTPF